MTEPLKALLRVLDERAWPQARRDPRLAHELAAVRGALQQLDEEVRTADRATLARLATEEPGPSEARRALTRAAQVALILRGDIEVRERCGS